MSKKDKEVKAIDQDYYKKELEIAKAKHNLKMEQLQYERETNRLFHEWSLERGRIQRAEKRKEFLEKNAWRSGR